MRELKRIIFVIQSMGFGGAERSLLNLLHELPRDQYEVDLLLFRNQGSFLDQLPSWINVIEQPEGLKALYSPFSKAGKYKWMKLIGTAISKTLTRTKKESGAFRWKHFYQKKVGCVSNQYDVAVAFSGSEVMYYVHDCVFAEKKYVWIHNDYRAAQYTAKYDVSYFEHMDGIVSVSDECVSILKEEFPQYGQKIFKIENITSSAIVRRQAGVEKPAEYKSGGNILLSIGRMVPQKGFDLAISAAAIMKRKNIPFMWYILGDGALCETLKMQIQEENVGDCVVLLGTRSNPYPYIKNASIFVQTSRFEGKSVVLDETKILGIPIVATDYPTVRDQIVAEKEGVIAPMTPEGIAQTICELLGDTNKRECIHKYLLSCEYGNQDEIAKYMALLG